MDARLPNGIRGMPSSVCLASPGTCIHSGAGEAELFIPRLHCLGLDESGAAQLVTRMIEATPAFLINAVQAQARRPCLPPCSPRCRSTSASSSSRIRASRRRTSRMRSGSRVAQRTPSLSEQSSRQLWSANHSECVRTGWWSVRSGAARFVTSTAMNTGHEGGCGTVHAHSTADVRAGPEALASLGGLPRNALRAQLASALDAVIHVDRDAAGVRRVAELDLRL